MPLIINVPRATDRIQVEARQQLSIAFSGTPHFAIPALRLLHESGWPIALVITAPDKPFGRKAVPTPSPIHEVARELGLSVATPASLKDESFQRTFAESRPAPLTG